MGLKTDPRNIRIWGAESLKPLAPTLPAETEYTDPDTGQTWVVYLDGQGQKVWVQVSAGAGAPSPHTHLHHSGVISRGHVALETLLGADSPLGPGVWRTRFPKVEIDDTILRATEIFVDCDAGSKPSASLQYVLKKNGAQVTVVTLSHVTGAGSQAFTPVPIEDGDELSVDFPEDALGALGIRVYVAIERVAVAT